MINEDLQYLISEYGNSKANYSQEASSHWLRLNDFQKIKIDHKNDNLFNKKGIRLNLSGGGFGEFKKLTILNLVTHLHVFLYLSLNLWRKLDLNTFFKTFRYSLKSRQLFGYDVSRLATTVDFLAKNIGDLDGKSILIIGDGYGRLGSILKSIFPNLTITHINLGKILIFDYFYSLKVFPDLKHKLVFSQSDFGSDFNYIEAEKYRNFKIKSDLIINIASMQEMNLKQIDDYFKLIKAQRGYFYCCNRVSKTLPDGTTVNFFDYPWGGLEIIVDEICPWYQKFPAVKPPFVRKFDGPIHHRLTKNII